MKTVVFGFALLLLYAGPAVGQNGNHDEVWDYNAQEGLREVEKLLANGTESGRDFWLAFPPIMSKAAEDGSLEIHISAERKTVVMLEVPQLGIRHIDTAYANQPLIFSTDSYDLDWRFVVRNSETVSELGLHIRSEHPIGVVAHSVFAGGSADAYRVLPYHELGTEYRHVGYYDYVASSDTSFPTSLGGGFLIVATEDETRVEYELRGKGQGQTRGGKQLGSRHEITLDRGHTYLVSSDGHSQTGFDMSGTIIKSSKPVALVSYSELTRIPVYSESAAASHISAMIPPVSAWGKLHVAHWLDWQGGDLGDVYRIVSAEAGCRYSIKRYDLQTGAGVGSSNGVILDGEVFYDAELLPGAGGTQSGGITVFQTDKPALVMQYGVGSLRPGSHNGSPLMMNLPPRSQFITGETRFYTPRGNGQARLYLFAVCDTGAGFCEHLKDIRLNGKPLYTISNRFLSNRIPGTDIFWAALPLGVNQHHRIECATKYAALVFGPHNGGHYGFTVAGAARKLDVSDTLAPQVQVKRECTGFMATATEMRNGSPGEFPGQYDQGIALLELDPDASYNMELEYITHPTIRPYLGITSFNFRISATDPNRPARAVYYVSDRAGNVLSDTLYYEPVWEELELANGKANFGPVRTRESRLLPLVISNPTDRLIRVTDVFVSEPRAVKLFSLIPGAFPQTLPPGKTLIVQCRYTPQSGNCSAENPDAGVVLVKTDCNDLQVGTVSGWGVQPEIAVYDWQVDSVKVGEVVCRPEGFVINNDGCDTLEVTYLGIDNTAAPFSFANGNKKVVFDPPLRIPPGSSFGGTPICFAPQREGRFSAKVVVFSDASNGDNVADLVAYSIDTTGTITSVIPVEGADSPLILGIHPHPLQDGARLHFFLPEDGPLVLSAIDVLGYKRMLLQQHYVRSGMHSITLDMTGLGAGMHVLQLNAAGQAVQYPVIVQR